VTADVLDLASDDISDVPLLRSIILTLAGDEAEHIQPFLDSALLRLSKSAERALEAADDIGERALEIARNAEQPSEDYARAVTAAQRAGELRGHRVGYQEGHAAGKAEAEAERPSTIATVQKIERDDTGKPVAITEQMEDGTVRRKALSYSEDGRLVGIEAVSATP
jgi:flagellar biosynthesis/type III secretory pathway protein FliH